MVKLINYNLIIALPIATSADPHTRSPLFTHSLLLLRRMVELQQVDSWPVLVVEVPAVLSA